LNWAISQRNVTMLGVIVTLVGQPGQCADSPEYARRLDP
jgi:hypothetical protein